jgi:carnitine monooxygenase subunit
MACRLEAIPEVGDYVEYRIFEKTIVIVRTATGVNAFHNICRHRGMRLVEGSGNCKTQGFVCPFHGWRYGLKGENTFVFARKIFSEELLDQADINLKPCRVETWGGCAFISFDDDAPPLREYLGPMAEHLEARHAERLRTEWWYASVLPTNWKMAVEAFLEQYHLMRTHSERHALTPSTFEIDAGAGMYRKRQVTSREAVHEIVDYFRNLSEGMDCLVHKSEVAVLERLRDMDVPDDPGQAAMAFFARANEEVAKDGLARGLPMFDLPKVASEYPNKGNEFIFPHFFMLPMFGSMASYRIRPLGPETCYFEIWSLILVPEGEPYESPREPTVLPHDSPGYPLIPRQDYSNLPNQQLGLRSGEIEHQRLSRDQEGAISNFERLIDGYLAGLDSGNLLNGVHIVNGGSFLPIRDDLLKSGSTSQAS